MQTAFPTARENERTQLGAQMGFLRWREGEPGEVGHVMNVKLR